MATDEQIERVTAISKSLVLFQEQREALAAVLEDYANLKRVVDGLSLTSKLWEKNGDVCYRAACRGQFSEGNTAASSVWETCAEAIDAALADLAK